MSKRSKNKSRKKTNQNVRDDQTKSADLTKLVDNVTKENDKQSSPISKRLYNYIAKLCYVLFGVASIVAAYFAWATFMDSRPPQVSVLFGYTNEQESEIVEIDTDKINRFYILTGTWHRGLFFEHINHLDYPGFPIIINNTNRTIKDFRLKVQIVHENLICDSMEVNPDYRLITDPSDSIFGITELFYNNNTLYPGQKVAMPVHHLRLSEKKPYSKEEAYSIYVWYQITYDGMSNDKSFIVYERVYFDNGRPLRNTGDQIDEFLDYCYTNKIFNDYYVAIFQNGKTYPVKLKNGTNKSMFEKYKKQLINTIKTDFKAMDDFEDYLHGSSCDSSMCP